MDEAKLDRGRIYMQIFIKFQTYNGETKEEQSQYFAYIFKRLKELGYTDKGAQFLFDKGRAVTATIDTEEKYFGVTDTGIVGASFCGGNPGKHLLSLKRIAEYFDEIVLNENKDLIDALYTIEYHERYRKK
jgi:hypothetical protein